MFVALVAVATSCDRGSAPTTESAGPATAIITTTTDSGLCRDLAGEAVALAADIVDRLDETTVDELTDPSAWGEDLVVLRERGAALDAEVAAAGCSVEAIREEVRNSLADMGGDSRLAEILVTLLAGGG